MYHCVLWVSCTGNSFKYIKIDTDLPWTIKIKIPQENYTSVQILLWFPRTPSLFGGGREKLSFERGKSPKQLKQCLVINKSKVAQHCLYSYRQRYSSSSWMSLSAGCWQKSPLEKGVTTGWILFVDRSDLEYRKLFSTFYIRYVNKKNFNEYLLVYGIACKYCCACFLFPRIECWVLWDTGNNLVTRSLWCSEHELIITASKQPSTGLNYS